MQEREGLLKQETHHLAKLLSKVIPSWVEFICERVHKVKVSALTNLIAISTLFCGMVSFPTALTQRIGGAVLSQMSFLAASMAHLPRHLSL